ncbi:MAG: hypothetical protein AAGC96_04735 [Pseudomonadota bacterium]
MINVRFDNTFLAVAAGIALLVSINFLSLLNLAPEVSDSAFYILNYTQPHKITNQLSMVGIIWFALVGEQSLPIHRALNFAIVFLSGAALGFTYTGSLVAIPLRIGASLLSGSAFMVAFVGVILGPSYNDQILVCFALCLVCARPFLFPILGQTAVFTPARNVWAVGFGASLFAMVLIKITSGAIAGVFFVAVYLALHFSALSDAERRPIFYRALFRLALLSLLGAVLVLLFLTLRGFDPSDLWARGVQGFVSQGYLAVHGLGLAENWKDSVLYAETVGNAWQKHTFLWLGLLGAGVLGAVFLFIDHSRYHWSLWTSAVLAIVTVAILYSQLGGPIENIQIELLYLLRFFSIALAVFLLWQCPVEVRRPLWILLLAAAMGPLFLSFGTNNKWAIHFQQYSGLAMAACATIFACAPQAAQRAMTPSFTALVCCLVLVVWNGMQHMPYRLGGPLGSAQVMIKFGPKGEPMRTTPAVAEAYVPLEALRAQLANQASRPVFLDLTGRAPGIGTFLGLDPPSVAWLIGGVPGSNTYFAYALSLLTRKRLQEAWILVPDPDHPTYTGLDIDILGRVLGKEKNLLAFYTPIARIEIGYVELPATLYKPLVTN